MDVAAIRRDIPALSRSVYLNAGGVAPLPAPVYRRMAQDLEGQFREGPPLNIRPESLQAEKDQARQAIASFLGADAGEICFTRGVSDGANIVMNGLPWRPGDEIILTNEEYPAFILPALSLARKRGVVVRVLPLENDAAAILERLERLLTERTRLLAFSHVTTDNGIRLPARDICRLAHDAGALVLYDGAQAAGQFPIDLHEMGCDFYGILSYKWLLGPYSAGALYLRREHIGALEVAAVGARAERSLDLESRSFELWDDARRFELGPFAWPMYFALAEATAYLSGIGPDAIEARVAGMASYLRRGLRAIPGVTVHSPEPPDLATGMVAFGIEGIDGPSINRQLRQRWNIVARATASRFDGMRLCVAFFNTTAELDLALEAVSEIARASGQRHEAEG